MITVVQPFEGDFQRSEIGNELRLNWDNRRVRRDSFAGWFFIVFWIFWAPATVFATWMIFNSDSPVFFSIWCIFGWLGTLMIPYSFVQRTWQEWVSFSPDRLEIGREGWLAGKPSQLPVERIEAITFGRMDEESALSLNVETKGKFQKRVMIGFWLHPELKERLYDELEAFAKRKQLPVRFEKGASGQAIRRFPRPGDRAGGRKRRELGGE